MRYLALLAITVFATSANAQSFTVTCDDLYPEHDSPDNSVAIAQVERNAAGAFVGLHCSVEPGNAFDNCDILDGQCCDCVVRRGFTPECTVIVKYDATTTHGSCVSAFPLCYYGGQCDSVSGAFVTVGTEGVTKRSTKKQRKASKPKR